MTAASAPPAGPPAWLQRLSDPLSRRTEFTAAALIVVLGAALLMFESRGTTLYDDELLVFAYSAHGFDLAKFLAAYQNHLIAIPNFVYWAVFSVFGADYLPLRFAGLAGIISSSVLLWVLLRRRIAPVLALAGLA